MAKKDKLYKGKVRKNRAEVGEFLQELGEKVKHGEVTLRQAGDDLVLYLPSSLQMKMKVSKKTKPVKGNQYKLTVKLTWHEGDQEAPLALG